LIGLKKNTQVRAGKTLSSFALRNDCEDYAQNCIHQAMSIMKLKHDLEASASSSNPSPAAVPQITGTPFPATSMTLDDIVCGEHFPDMGTDERISLVQATHSLLQQVESIESVNLTCNAQVMNSQTLF
jgi:hypothetical protein